MTMEVNGKSYRVVRLLGKGKGGYSYLVTDGKDRYVLKQIHHEPCDYYQFGDKLASELHDYERLCRAGVPMPRMLEVDHEKERILKNYIDGPTVYELVLTDGIKDAYFSQIGQMCESLYAQGLNIDYFPTNFVVMDEKLYYIDYECNSYDPKWNFENWGIQYWSKTETFMEYVRDKEKENR